MYVIRVMSNKEGKTLKSFDTLLELFCEASLKDLSKNKRTAFQLKLSMNAAKRRAEVMLLREVYNMSFKEIGEDMGVHSYTARRIYKDAIYSFSKNQVLHDLLTS